VGYVALTVVLLYFLLTVEDLVTRLFAAVLPPDDRKKALEITVEASHSVSRYLATIAMINMGLGVATGVAMWLSGMPNPALWGVMAALMPFIPYLGAAVGVAVLTTVSFTTFDSWSQALLPPLLYLALACLEGGFVTPSVLGRRLLLNPVAVLLSLMFWGLLWGIVGAILAVPLLTILKIICDHIKSLAFVSELLSRD
jgi:predicted PurR-regulated permease PerM